MPVNTIPLGDITQIDRKICKSCPWIKYLRDEEYIDTYLKKYIQRIKKIDEKRVQKGEYPLDVIEKVEKFFDESQEYFGFDFAGTVERSKAHKKLLEQFFSQIVDINNVEEFLSVDVKYLRDIKLEGKKIKTPRNLEGKDWLPVIVVKSKRCKNGRHVDKTMLEKDRRFYSTRLGKELENEEICTLYTCYPGEDTYRFLGELSETTFEKEEPDGLEI